MLLTSVYEEIVLRTKWTRMGMQEKSMRIRVQGNESEINHVWYFICSSDIFISTKNLL